MRAAEHAPREPYRLLQRRHGLAKIVERGAIVPETLLAAHQLAATLIELGRYGQVKSFVLPLLRHGRSFRLAYAKALYMTAGASRAEVLGALAICEELLCMDRRVLGPSHPDTLEALRELDRASMTLEDYRKFKS